MLLRVHDLHGESIKESQDRRNFDSARAPFVICTRVKNLHSCWKFAYVLQLCTRVTWKMHSFSSDQMHVIFLIYVIKPIKYEHPWFSSVNPLMIISFISKDKDCFFQLLFKENAG